MNNTDYNAANFNRGRYTINAIKKIATIVVAIFFVLGCMYVPGSEFVGEAHAVDGIAGNYVEGEVIVSYVDTKDMNLTSSQEKKIDNTLGDAEEIMTLEDVSLADVDVDESKLVKSVQKSGEIDETMAVVSSDDKSTKELVSEIEQLPNVDNVCPNFIFRATEETLEPQIKSEEPEVNIEEEETTPADTDGSTVEEDTVSEEAVEAAEIEDTDKYIKKQWAYNGSSEYGMNITNWNKPEYKNAEGTVVAVLDTGIDYTHEDLDDVMWKNGDVYGFDMHYDWVGPGKNDYKLIHDYDPIDDNYSGKSNHSHGTHVAGIIAAEWNETGVSGLANGTKIMAVKAGNSEGALFLDTILSGYNYIISKAYRNNIVAINNSWGGAANEAAGKELSNVVSQAGAKGIVSVFASGNDSRNCDAGGQMCSYLKDNPYAVVVNATDASGELTLFSNYGKTTTDIGAPGSTIMSTVRTDADVLKNVGLIEPYGSKSGTSMATPAVTGEAAILAAKFPDADADVIASIIKGNTRSNNGRLDGTCRSAGQADVDKALGANPNDIKYRHFSLNQLEFTYNGEIQKPIVSEVTGALAENEDFNVEYPNSINVGNYSASIYPDGKLQGDKQTLSYTINKATPQVSLRSGGYIYDGGVKSNAVTVKGADGATWTNGNQYKLSGTLSAKMPGTYSVTVTPTDTSNYNAVSKSFSISVQPTTIKSLSGAKKAFKVKAAKKGKNYVTGYQVRYSLNESMSGAKTKTIGTKYSRVSKKVTKLKAKKTYYVQVRSYKTISKKKYYSSWSAVKSVKTK